MVIVSVCHYEGTALKKQEHFISREVADQHTRNWQVTAYGHIYYHDIQVTEK